MQKEAYPSLQKVNMGVYGAQVSDITAYDNGGSSEILIAADSIKGVYKWTSGATSWQAVTYPAVVGKASQIEMNLAPGYENDVYAIISDTTGIVMLYGSDSGGSSGSWSSIFSIMGTHILHGHSTGMYVATFDGKVYRSTGGVTDSFDLLYNFGVEVTSVSAYNSKTFFAATRSGSVTTLYKVTSSGGAFSATPIALPVASASAGAVEVHLVGVDPTNVTTSFWRAVRQILKSTGLLTVGQRGVRHWIPTAPVLIIFQAAIHNILNSTTTGCSSARQCWMVRPLCGLLPQVFLQPLAQIPSIRT